MSGTDQMTERGLAAPNADMVEALLVCLVKSADLQHSLASCSVALAQSTSRALLTINRDLAQMSLDRMAKPDLLKIATLTPRVLEAGLRERNGLGGSVQRHSRLDRELAARHLPRSIDR